jgi:metaxin
MSQTNQEKEEENHARAAPQRTPRSLFAVPTPIKQLFDQFPLLTYPVNDLPQRAPQHRNTHVLYIFTSEDGALKGLPSYNPACLKWQVRAPSDLLQPHTHGIAGLPQVLQYRLPNSFSE